VEFLFVILTNYSSYLWSPLRFPRLNVHDIQFTPICFAGFMFYLCYFYLPVGNTCVYPRCLIKFILLYLLSCDVISIIVFVFLFFFFSPLCVSSELQRLITPLYLHNFIAKWTTPPKWKKTPIISNLLLQIKIVSIHTIMLQTRLYQHILLKGRRGRDHIVVGLTTNPVISVTMIMS
jgi:hypothetical protein